MAVQRGRLRDRVQAVERVREVDEAALRADGGNGLAEGHAPRDLFLQEEPDYLSLVGRLHLLARNDDDAAAASPFHCLEGATENVVVGDRDRAEPLCLGVVEQLV